MMDYFSGGAKPRDRARVSRSLLELLLLRLWQWSQSLGRGAAVITEQMSKVYQSLSEFLDAHGGASLAENEVEPSWLAQ